MSNRVSALDLTKAPYSRTRSSFMVFEENNSDGENIKTGLYLAVSAQSDGARRKGLVDIVPIVDGETLPFTYTATPSSLALDTDRGRIRIVMDTNHTMRICGQGVGVRFYTEIPFMAMEQATLLPNGIVDLNLLGIRPGGGRFFFVAREGRVTVDSVFNVLLNGPENAKVELLPSDNGYFEAAVYASNPDEWGYIDYKQVDESIAETESNFRGFLALYPQVDAKWQSLKELCAYVVWLHYQGKNDMAIIPTMKADMIYSNRVTDGEAKAFLQPLHAMAMTNAGAALELIKNIFPHMAGGMLPTAVSNSRIYYQAFPPTHGLAVLQLLEQGVSGLGKEALEPLYAAMTDHYAWWVKSHRFGENHFSYNLRDEYGFAGASYSVLPFPLETPDLYTYMILYTQALAKLSETIGDGKRGAWTEISAQLLGVLIELWNGERFVCRNAFSNATFSSDSLLAYLPVILGKRLKGDVMLKLTVALADEDGFLSARGFRSESRRSQYCDPAVSGRGAVDMALQMLVIGGLFDAGVTDLAREAATRLLTYASENGVRDVLASEGDQPARRPADELNALGCSALLYLGHKLHDCGKGQADVRHI